MNLAQERAREIRRRYRLTRPADVERILERVGAEIQRVPMEGRLEELVILDQVLIKDTIEDKRRVHELMAHALGHVLMHEGNQVFYYAQHNPVLARQWEHQAWTFAFELLIPTAALEAQIRKKATLIEVREHFEVSDTFLQARLQAYVAEREGRAWDDDGSKADWSRLPDLT